MHLYIEQISTVYGLAKVWSCVNGMEPFKSVPGGKEKETAEQNTPHKLTMNNLKWSIQLAFLHFLFAFILFHLLHFILFLNGKGNKLFKINKTNKKPIQKQHFKLSILDG